MREGYSAHERLDQLKAETLTALILLVVYALATYGWLFNLTPIRGTLGLLLSLGIAWISLRLRPIYLMLILMTVIWGAHDPYQRVNSWEDAIQLSAWTVTLYLFRTQMSRLISELSPFAKKIFAPKAEETEEFANSKEPSPSRENMVAIRNVISAMVVILIAVVASTLSGYLLSSNPLGVGQRAWTNWAVAGKQALGPNHFLLVALIGIAIVLYEWGRRQLMASQARLSIRTQTMAWQYTELKRIIRQRRKLLQRKNDRGYDRKESEY